jgi:AcrR family transcriptional regulator
VCVVGLVYHDGMTVSRQGGSADALGSGRSNQKRRTRAAIVDAARQLLERGVTPTVQQAAEGALVSRTTAYRYFPTQDSLLIEVAVGADVDDVEELVARPVTAEEAEDRIVAVVDLLNRHVLEDEVRYRTVLRLYLEQWLAAAAAGETDPVVREGRRRRWIATTLTPLESSVPAADLRRLSAALACVLGAEVVVALRDTARLPADEVRDVTRWAARALVRATLDGARQDGAPDDA